MRGFVELTALPDGSNPLGNPEKMLVRSDAIMAVLDLRGSGAWPDRTRVDFGGDCRVVVESYQEVKEALFAALGELDSEAEVVAVEMAPA